MGASSHSHSHSRSFHVSSGADLTRARRPRYSFPIPPKPVADLMHRFVFVGVLAVGCTPAPKYDVVLQGGRVMDPASGLDSIRNVGITGGKIAVISSATLAGTTVVDATGKVVA